MKFVLAFIIVIACLIPFLIGAGFGLDALLGYCTSDSSCRDYELCENSKCVDGCANIICDNNKHCYILDHAPRCECQSGFVFNQNTNKCEQPNSYCVSDISCDLLSKCINGTCTNICDESTCGPFEVCEVNVVTREATCSCLPNYGRHPTTKRCLKRCFKDEHCDDGEACKTKTWCITPCKGKNPPHTFCVAVGHKATYQCEKCYRVSNDGHECEPDTDDVSCSTLIGA